MASLRTPSRWVTRPQLTVEPLEREAVAVEELHQIRVTPTLCDFEVDGVLFPHECVNL